MAVPKGQFNPELEFAQLEIEAKASARQYVAKILQAPENLEKVEQIRKNSSKKKSSVEAQLKTSIQSQLDGVRTGLNQLQNALKDIGEINNSLIEIDELCFSINHLDKDLKDLRAENTRHSQLAAAVENLKHIFTVPETVEKCRDYISDEKLLHAHKCLTDLESSRDDLLFELHKSPQQQPSDKQTIISYYSGVPKLSEELGKQLWVILQRTTLTALREPKMIVNAVRIIEREEKIDEFCKKRSEIHDGFLPLGRPKCWRQKAFQVFEEVIRVRVESNQMEERQTTVSGKIEENKMWLVKHLEVTRQLMLEDLRIIKNQCDMLFPPHWDIYQRYVQMYHSTISQHLQEVISQGLEGNEVVTLLSWVETYTGEELLGSPDLHIRQEELPPVLDQDTVQSLKKQYLLTIRTNFQGWMKRSLDTEAKDWFREQPPETDDKGFFFTGLSVLIFDMIQQNIQVATSIKANLTKEVLNISMEELDSFVNTYEKRLQAYKDHHLANRSEPQYYLPYMMAAINNCGTFRAQVQLVGQQRSGVIHSRTPVIAANFDQLAQKNCEVILEEAFVDLHTHNQQLITRKWLQDSVQIDTICLTLEDYFKDFVHIKEPYYTYLVKKSQMRVLKEYVKALVSKKIEFKNYDERGPAGEKIIREADQLMFLFRKLSPPDKDEDSSFELLKLLAEMIKLRDSSMISLEISTVVNKYPDVGEDHLINILLMREDQNRSQAKATVVDILNNRPDGAAKSRDTVFSHLND